MASWTWFVLNYYLIQLYSPCLRHPLYLVVSWLMNIMTKNSFYFGLWLQRVCLHVLPVAVIKRHDQKKLRRKGLIFSTNVVVYYPAKSGREPGSRI